MNSALAPERNVVPSVSVINKPCGIPLLAGAFLAAGRRRFCRQAALVTYIGRQTVIPRRSSPGALEKPGRRDDRNAAKRVKSEQVGVAANDQISLSVHRNFEELVVFRIATRGEGLVYCHQLGGRE